MPAGLKTTFDLLAKTPNEAAVHVLVPALDSPSAEVRLPALSAILTRRSPSGLREIMARWHGFDRKMVEVVTVQRVRMSAALRDCILCGDEQSFENACRAAIVFPDYDVTAALVHAVEEQGGERADLAASTLIELVLRLVDELRAPRDYRERRDPVRVRQHVLESLEESVRRYTLHKRPEVVESFLLLARRGNALLHTILSDPHEASYLCVVDLLTRGESRAIVEMLLSFLDDPRPPSTVLAIIAHRADEMFVNRLLEKVGDEPAAVLAANLKRLETIPWIADPAMISRLSESQQVHLVAFLVASGIRRSELLRVLGWVLRHAGDAARQAACAALEPLGGVEANALILRALDDSDPRVQVAALVQLRPRGIPGGMSRLVALAESPHREVREAVRSQLEEFRLERYLAAFDGLDDDVRQSTGRLVRKLDPAVIVGLRDEMAAPARSRRLRAIAAADALRVVDDLLEPLTESLGDEDHMVRAQAARVLGSCTSADAVRALKRAARDKSPSVRQAACESLERLGVTIALEDHDAVAMRGPTTEWAT